MQEATPLCQVSEFHKTFKHPISQSPVIPTDERCALRVTLLAEEVNELQDAIINKDLVGIADALCDIQYVLTGTVLEFGLGEKFKELFDEVHRSNMSKACKTEEEALETIEYYKAYESYYKQEKKLFLVYRRSDQKLLKSINYSPGDLRSILNSTND